MKPKDESDEVSGVEMSEGTHDISKTLENGKNLLVKVETDTERIGKADTNPLVIQDTEGYNEGMIDNKGNVRKRDVTRESIASSEFGLLLSK